MALTEDQIVQTVRDLLAALDGAPFNHAKADVRAAIAAADTWASSNATSFNSALPQPFRGNATTAEKAALLAYVALRRAGK